MYRLLGPFLSDLSPFTSSVDLMQQQNSRVKLSEAVRESNVKSGDSKGNFEWYNGNLCAIAAKLEVKSPFPWGQKGGSVGASGSRPTMRHLSSSDGRGGSAVSGWNPCAASRTNCANKHGPPRFTADQASLRNRHGRWQRLTGLLRMMTAAFVVMQETKSLLFVVCTEASCSN